MKKGQGQIGSIDLCRYFRFSKSPTEYPIFLLSGRFTFRSIISVKNRLILLVRANEFSKKEPETDHQKWLCVGFDTWKFKVTWWIREFYFSTLFDPLNQMVYFKIRISVILTIFGHWVLGVCRTLTTIKMTMSKNRMIQFSWHFGSKIGPNYGPYNFYNLVEPITTPYITPWTD